MTFNIKKTLALPDFNDRVSNCLYMVKSQEADVFEFHWSNESKDIISGITDNYIQTLITQATSDLSTLYYAATITDRDALDFTVNSLVLVVDASDDVTVVAGSAMYFYVASLGLFQKVVEFESMDITLSWDNLANKPTSTVANIDDAVTKRHDHGNKAVIDKLSEAGGKVLFDGKQVGVFVYAAEMPVADLVPNALYIINNVTSGQLEFHYVETDGITTHVAFVKSDVAALLNARITTATLNQYARYDGAKWVGADLPYDIQFASSDEATALTVGTSKITLRAPRAFVLTGIKASLSIAQTSGSLLTVNVKKGGVSLFTTQLTFNNTSRTTVGASTPAVLTAATIAIAADDEFTVDIAQVGDGTAKGLKISLLGHLTNAA